MGTLCAVVDMSIERKEIPCACAGFNLAEETMRSWAHLSGMVDLVLPKLKGTPDRVALLKAKNRAGKNMEDLVQFVTSYGSEINRIRQTADCD